MGGAGAPVPHRLARLATRVPERSAGPSVPVLEMPARVPYPALPDPEADRVAIGVESNSRCRHRRPARGAAGGGGARADRADQPARRPGRAGPPLRRRRVRCGSGTGPVEIILAGPRASDAPGRYDHVLDDPAAVTAWVHDRLARGPDGWRLLLVDDAHVWERAWEAGGPARDAITALASIVDRSAELGLAVVVATDLDEARSRQHVPGVVTAARRGRRGVLLQPDFADGSLFSAMVPSTTSEPLTGRAGGCCA